MCMGGGGSGSAAAQARADEQARQARISESIARVNDVFGGFNQDFYDQRAGDYQNYAIPQLDLQAAEARRGLAYRMANAGLTRSSPAAKSLTDFERDYSLKKQEVVDEARRVANEARGNVESARSNLISLAQATGDSAAVGNAATNQAIMLAARPSFSPLGQVFQNFGAVAKAGRDQEMVDAIRRSAGGAVRTYDIGNAGSGRVVS